MNDLKTMTQVLGQIMETLEPLKQHERARVMLMVILKTAPNMLGPAQLAALVEQAKEPCENALGGEQTARCNLPLGHGGSHRGDDGRRWA